MVRERATYLAYCLNFSSAVSIFSRSEFIFVESSSHFARKESKDGKSSGNFTLFSKRERVCASSPS